MRSLAAVVLVASIIAALFGCAAVVEGDRAPIAPASPLVPQATITPSPDQSAAYWVQRGAIEPVAASPLILDVADQQREYIVTSYEVWSAVVAAFAAEDVERAQAVVWCESRGDPREARQPGQYGLFQFSPATWRSVGGEGWPHEASAKEQAHRASLLHARNGWRDWECAGQGWR